MYCGLCEKPKNNLPKKFNPVLFSIKTILLNTSFIVTLTVNFEFNGIEIGSFTVDFTSDCVMHEDFGLKN